MNDMNKISIYNKVAAVTNSSPKLGEQLKRMAAFIFALSAFTLITSCTEDDLVTQTTPLAPQGMKTVTVDFQLPEGKPAFGEGETRATTTDGTWANGDELMMTLAVRNINEEISGGTADISSASVYLTLVHDGAAWDVNEAKSYSVTAMGGAITAKPYAQQPLLAASQDLALTSLTLMLDENFGEVDECFVQVFYAPDVERVVGADGTQTLQLKATATTTAPEMWQAVAVGGTGSLALQWMDNDQARLRVRTGTAGDVVTLTSSAFTPNLPKSADGIYTATTQTDGYAYFYGLANGGVDDGGIATALTSGFNLSLTAVTVGEGDAAFTCPIAPVTLLEASTLVPVQLVEGKSYCLDATEKRPDTESFAVIDGTLGDEAAILEAIAAGKTTLYVTGEPVEDIVNAISLYSGATDVTIDLILADATAIGDNAFYFCDALKSVSLPAATTIGTCAFQGCSALTSVSLPVATSIGDCAFEGCSALKTLTFGTVITSVGTDVFDGTLADGTTAWTTQCDLTLGAGSTGNPEAGENKTWAGYTWKSITLVDSN